MRLAINREGAVPLYRQIWHQIRQMILSGQLPAGFRLPPERRLAESLGLTRTTVVNAYDELKAEGLLDARVGFGTVVRAAKHTAPEGEEARGVVWSHLFRDQGLRPPDPLVRNLLEMATRTDVIPLAIGLPSPAHLPLEAFREIFLRLLDEVGPHLLLHAPTEGHSPLRETMSHWLTTRGIRCSAEEVLILSGSQQGLDLAGRIFINPGDPVVVEAPTFFGALEAFRRAGARIISVPVDADGLMVEHLSSLLRHHRPKLIYTLPTYQNPSGAVMSLERRRQLLYLAGRYGIPILEDDSYSELCYDGEPVLSLKAMDVAGIVIHLGTFSKILYPGLRIGWLVAPRPVVRQFALLKQTVDLHSNTAGQHILDRFVSDGKLEAHLATLRRVYRTHRDIMASALEENRIEGMAFRTPQGGFYFWCELPRTVDRARLMAAATERKVSFLPGQACFVEEPQGVPIRLNFSYPTPDAIAEGVPRLLDAIRSSITRTGRVWDASQAATRPIV